MQLDDYARMANVRLSSNMILHEVKGSQLGTLITHRL